VKFEALNGLSRTGVRCRDFIYLSLTLLIIFFGMAIAMMRGDENALGTLGMVFFTWFIFSVLYLLLRSAWEHMTDRQAETKYEKFAADNKLQYHKDYSDSANFRTGSIFRLEGQVSKKISHHFEGQFGNLHFESFNFSYSVSRSSHSVDIIEIQLPHTVPHLVVDSLLETIRVGNSQSALPIDFSVGQKIELEGEFSRYFAIYALDGHEIHAKEIFTPEIMEAIMKLSGKCDIEMVSDKMYFYWPEQPRTKQAIEERFKTVNRFWKATGHRFATKAKPIGVHISGTYPYRPLKRTESSMRSK
jgi:hypothetical protein